MAQQQQASLPTVFVMFGATGDLAKTKLIPALWQLYKRNRLPDLFQVVAFSRRDLSDQAWREYVKDVVGTNGEATDAVDEFLKRFSYQPGQFDDDGAYERLAERLGRQDKQWQLCANKIFYLAVPPQYYKTIFQHLSGSGLTEPCSPEEGWTRVVVEKPFGKDLATAQELDELLGQLFREEQIYRVDHYLGKDTVQNILAFRFSNTFLQPAWSGRSIESMTFRSLEEKGVAERGGFYDGVGALRDVGQNHLLQMLALFTMERPASFSAEAIRKQRTEVLEALEVMDQQDVARHTVRGQYEGYREVPGVNAESQTETYFRLQASLPTGRWQGVPLYLESGKSLDQSKAEITVRFRHETPCLCPPQAGKHYTNELTYRIQPQEKITTSFWVKKPGPEMVIEERDFSFDYHAAFTEGEFIEAYEKLLLDIIRGDQTLFVSTAEVMASWRFIDPIISAWEAGAAPLQSYASGSDGPAPASSDLPLPAKRIGYVGLGKMGSNMAARLVEHQWSVVAYDPDEAARTLAAAAGATTGDTLSHLVEQLPSPRTIWMMVPHQAVDEVFSELVAQLTPGDTIIDGGNSLYTDSQRRAAQAAKHQVRYLDVGVSGGPQGARRGACLMVGGARDVYKEYVPLFSDLATAGGYDYMGASGAGHFVKMVHNGIEYGMMQALGEGFAIMHQQSKEFDLQRIASLYNHGSVIESALVGWLKDAYAEYGHELKDISGRVAHSGEGLWTVEAAEKLDVPAPVIAAALQFRIDSEQQPSYVGKIVSALRNQFGGHDVSAKAAAKKKRP